MPNRLLHPSGHETRPLQFTGRQTFLWSEPVLRPWFSRITRHETRITAFFESRLFLVCPDRRVVRNAGKRSTCRPRGARCAGCRHPRRQHGFMHFTKHATRNTAFPVARLVPVGTEALQSCFFGPGLLGIRTGCRKSPGSTCPRRGVRSDGGRPERWQHGR